MKIWARKSRLYYGRTRIGQIIIHTFKSEDLPTYQQIEKLLNKNITKGGLLYNTNFQKISRQLVIDKKRFKELLEQRDYKTLVSLPLYSKRYFPKWLLRDSLEPIDFDFIQVEGKALIYADGSDVKLIGEIDEETSYHLLYYGIIISTKQIIKGINYAIKNNQQLRNVGDKSFMMLSQLLNLMKAGFIKKIKDVTQNKGMFIIKTSEGVYYGTKTILTNDDVILNTNHPFKTGTIIKMLGNDYIALNYEFKENVKPLIFVETNKNSVMEEIEEILSKHRLHIENPLPFIKIGNKRIFLQGHLSILSSTITVDGKKFPVIIPRSIRIINKPKLKKIDGKWVITYKVEFSYQGTVKDYIDDVDSLIHAHNMEHEDLHFDKMSKKLDYSKYKKLIDKIAEAEFFGSFNLVTNGDTHLWYKVSDTSLQDGVIYVLGYGKPNINGLLITNEIGESNLIIKTETGEYKTYKIVRLDNVFKREILGRNFIIRNKAKKPTIKIIRAVSQLIALASTIPANFEIEVTEETIKIIIDKRKLFTYSIQDFNVYLIKNTFMVYTGKPPRGFILPVEHEIVKNFVSALFINFNKLSGYWLLGSNINKDKHSFVNYYFFNGMKLDKPLFLQGEFEIAGVKIKPSNYYELNNEFSVLISDLHGETIKVPIIKNRSLLNYI